MSRFTKALRQRIVQDFAVRHNGQYDPTLFLQEVRDTGASHPAHGWFEWNQGKAALAYQVEQARDFARDLRVSFTVQVVSGGKRKVAVRETAMPLVISPLEGRRKGGGYLLVDPDDPVFMVEHCMQAALGLRSWLSRYRSALDHVASPAAEIEALAVKLEAVALPSERAA